MRCFAGWLCVSLALGVVEHALADDASKDQQQLQGTWKVLAGNEGGKTLPPPRAKGSKVVVSGNHITVYEEEKKREMTFKLDPTKEPRTIDLTLTEGKDKGETSPGIYALEGELLKIAFALPGKARPTTFTPKQGSQEMLFVLKRAKPKD
jgi:uncharacterized protein (TIGR03067 family)